MNMAVCLKNGIFETGLYRVPSTSHNPIVLGEGGSSNGQLILKQNCWAVISPKNYPELGIWICCSLLLAGNLNIPFFRFGDLKRQSQFLKKKHL